LLLARTGEAISFVVHAAVEERERAIIPRSTDGEMIDRYRDEHEEDGFADDDE